MPGVLRTRVGYCGGEKPKPTYRSMRDHTEAISIDYDPQVTSYKKLLHYFWNSHRCQYSNSSRQYMNAIFYRNEEQKKIAEESLTQRASYLKIPVSDVKTEILPEREFTYAEGYHQKYYLTQHADIRGFLEENYADAKSLADSTVATRLNAYLGSGQSRNWNVFLKELPSYGLPEGLEDRVRKYAESKR